MEQHPIPQQISSYQFRLVGDMTLKQFFQVAGGALVSLLIYSTNIYPIIKWPLIIFFFGLGAALAFLPFEERPLSKWIVSFFRSIYSPTAYFWQRQEGVANFFQEEAPAPKEEGVIAPHGEVALESYLNQLPAQSLGFLTNLEGYEVNFLKKVKDIYSSAVVGVQPAAEIKTKEIKKEVPTQAPKKSAQVPPTTPTPVSVASKGFRPKIVIEEKPLQEKPISEKDITSKVKPILGEGSVASQQAQFSLQAAPPNPPTIPNTIVGQVFNPDGKIQEGAILEIRDVAGRPVRAVRSNKLGHFMIVTSLQNGNYEIITEKEGMAFEPITFEAEGEIIPPIVIKARSWVNTQPNQTDPNSQNIATI